MHRDEGCATNADEVVMPFGGDRAMVTIDPGARASSADVAAHAPRAVAASLDQLFIVPEGSLAFITCGDDDGRAYAGRPPRRCRVPTRSSPTSARRSG
jgi:hypothetical protein